MLVITKLISVTLLDISSVQPKVIPMFSVDSLPLADTTLPTCIPVVEVKASVGIKVSSLLIVKLVTQSIQVTERISFNSIWLSKLIVS